MVRPIMRDMLFLSQASTPATPSDAAVITDLKDTLRAHAEGCVGMAANMIGVHRRIIIVAMGPTALVLVNPVITEKRGLYEAEEGCLSLSGTRRTKRYRIPNLSGESNPVLQSFHHKRSRTRLPYLLHCFLKFQAIFGLFNGLRRRSNQFHMVFS